MAFTIVYIDSCYEWLHDLPARDRTRLLARVDRWEAWYRENIPIADELYDEWLIDLKKDGQET